MTLTKAWHPAQVDGAHYNFPYLSHATMEPLYCTAMVSDDSVTLWVPTQAPTMCARVAAAIQNIPLENVAVNITMLGGGFGRRSAIDFVTDAVYIARQLPNTPVQVIWSREDDMTLGYYRPIGSCRMRGAISDSGEVLEFTRTLSPNSTFRTCGISSWGCFLCLSAQASPKAWGQHHQFSSNHRDDGLF